MHYILGTLLWGVLGGILSAQPDYTFSDNGAQRKFRIAQEETELARKAAATSRSAQRTAGPVFYDLSELPARATAQRRAAAKRTMTERLLIRMPGGEKDYAAVRDLTNATKGEQSIDPGWWIVSYPDAWAALTAVEKLSGDKVAKRWELIPLFTRERYTKGSSTRNLQREVNDPLFEHQWNLAGGDVSIGLGDTWDSVTGKGINITVIDDGLEVAHPDLRDNVYPLSSNFHRNFNGGPVNDPTPGAAKDSHGTSCAGIVAARGFNNLGVVGVAPEARMMGLRLIAGEQAEDAEGTAFGWQPGSIVTHVSSNSWGPADDGADGGRAGRLTVAGMRKAVTENRNGLGTVIVISAGNGRGAGDDSSYDGYSSSRYAIAVGAVNIKGESSSFSERGINVAISAPGGEFAPPETIWTTNNSGAEANGILHTAQETSEAPEDYTDAFNGTSAAAPHVSGAAALLLEKYPSLGYRDVKEILMRSANRDPLTDGDPFVTNGGGIAFSHSFGAGLLNVSGALALANNWKNLGTLDTYTDALPEINKAIPDGSTEGVTVAFDLAGQPNLRVESVEFTVSVKHPVRGDLAFQLESPSGMKSLAQPRAADENADFTNYTFTTVRHWGESSRGVWKLTVADVAAGDAGTFQSASIAVYGTR